MWRRCNFQGQSHLEEQCMLHKGKSYIVEISILSINKYSLKLKIQCCPITKSKVFLNLTISSCVSCGRETVEDKIIKRTLEKEEKTRIFLTQSKHYKLIVIKTV